MLDYIQQKINEGVKISYIKQCSSQDSASTVNVPLYSGDCIENAYFSALARAGGPLRSHILDSLNPLLQNEMVIRFAQNPRGKGISTLGSLLNNLNLKFSIPEFTRFISAACSGMSTTEHQLFLAKLEQNKDMYINVGIDSENTVAIDTAFASCQRQILENESKLDKYLTDVTEFLCGNTNAYSPVTKCPSSTNFRYRNWRLP